MFPYCNLYSRGNDQAMAVGGCRSRYNDLGLLSIRNLKLSRVSLSILRSQGTYTRLPKQNQKYQSIVEMTIVDDLGDDLGDEV